MTLQLRPYQRAAIDAIYGYFEQHDGHPIVVIPTAGGKSLVAAAFIQEVLAQWPDERIIILTHVRELISQNFAELIRLWPDAPAGIYSAGLNRRDVQAQILFAGIQSVHRKAYTIQRADLVLVDEAHLIPRTANTTCSAPASITLVTCAMRFARGASPARPSSVIRPRPSAIGLSPPSSARRSGHSPRWVC
jgi:DNA repair protein RadD